MSAQRFHYLPGAAVAVVHERVAVLLDAAADDPMVSRVAELVLAGAGVDDVLDALVTSGLKGLIDFGAFEVRADGVRLVVRGRVSGSVGPLAGVVSQHTMWHDTWQPGQTSAALAVADAADGSTLPVGSGAVLAAMVSYAEPAALVEPPKLVESPELVELVETMAPELAEPVETTAPAALAEPPNVVEPVETMPPPVTDAAPVADTDFAQLFGATQRPPVLSEEVDAPAEPEPETAPEPEPDEVVEPSASDPSATMATPLTIPPEDLPERPAAPASTPAPGLITGMPWLTDAGSGPATPPAPTAPATPAPPARVVEPPRPASPAVAPAPAVEVPAPPVTVTPPIAPASPSEAAADRTINRASLVGRPPVVMVTAIRCAQGHPNPTYAGKCRVCGSPMPPQLPTEIPRPTLGQLRLSTGGIVPLDRPAFLGRNPQVPAGYAAEQPNLVRLPDPDKDVSGQHLEVSLDYWNVLVRDLGSTNGTEVILPGEMPVALRANDPVLIEPGARVVLAGTISFIFEVVA